MEAHVNGVVEEGDEEEGKQGNRGKKRKREGKGESERELGVVSGLGFGFGCCLKAKAAS